MSPTAIETCTRRLCGHRPDWRFLHLDPHASAALPERLRTCGLHEFAPADLALSLDVIQHLVEDDAFEAHVRNLFACAARFVLVYTTDHLPERPSAPHVRHRRYSASIDRLAPEFTLVERVASPLHEHWREREHFCVFERG